MTLGSDQPRSGLEYAADAGLTVCASIVSELGDEIRHGVFIVVTESGKATCAGQGLDSPDDLLDFLLDFTQKYAASIGGSVQVIYPDTN